MDLHHDTSIAVERSFPDVDPGSSNRTLTASSMGGLTADLTVGRALLAASPWAEPGSSGASALSGVGHAAEPESTSRRLLLASLSCALALASIPDLPSSVIISGKRASHRTVVWPGSARSAISRTLASPMNCRGLEPEEQVWQRRGTIVIATHREHKENPGWHSERTLCYRRRTPYLCQAGHYRALSIIDADASTSTKTIGWGMAMTWSFGFLSSVCTTGTGSTEPPVPSLGRGSGSMCPPCAQDIIGGPSAHVKFQQFEKWGGHIWSL